MLTMVIGGAASGKSEFAEGLMLDAPLPRYYIATMQPFGKEAEERIAKHRAMRAKKQFSTIECYTGLEHLRLPERGSVLLECMSNLTANERYSPDGAGDGALDAIVRGIHSLCRQSDHVVIVTNEVFSGGNQYEGDTDGYLRLLARVNIELAKQADNVIEVVCGLPHYHKREGRTDDIV